MLLFYVQKNAGLKNNIDVKLVVFHKFLIIYKLMLNKFPIIRKALIYITFT